MSVKKLRTTSDEQELVQRISQGDSEAFRILFERYRIVVYRFCHLMVGSRMMAEDVYQEAFLAFYDACCKGDTFRNVRGYLMTVARNRCLNILRDRQQNVVLEDDQELHYEHDPTLPDTSELLQKALLKIPEQYREAFLLFELEGYSYSEIADYCGVDRNIVKNRIYRAKQSLKKILGPLLHDR